MASRSEAYFVSFLLVIVIVLASAAVPIQATLLRGQSGNYSDLGVMRPDQETLREWVNRYNSAPRVAMGSESRLMAGYPASFSLLNHIQYTPSERNQGNCGNCWAWAATGVLEVALDVQVAEKDRLSVQYLNSNYHGGTGTSWACCGGWLNSFSSFYSSKGLAIPWSNTNAGWSDGGKYCNNYPTSVPASSISTSPKYPITSITDEVVPTQGQGQATAISNIKAVLNQNRAVWFAFFLATDADWYAFGSFWWLQPETAVWDMDAYSGHTADSGFAGHAVLIVGYDDSNPSNRYWIVLNSWGTAGGNRPNGLFRLKMDINYDDYYYDAPYNYYSLYWQTLAVSFHYTMTVSYSVADGGSPTAPTFNYIENATSKNYALTPTPHGVSVDPGSAWSVTPNPLVGSTSLERWWTSQPTSGSATSSQTIVFSYQHQYNLTTQANPSNGGTVAPASGWQRAGSSVSVQATANIGYAFSSWNGTGTGSFTGVDSPATITMNSHIVETGNFQSLLGLNLSIGWNLISLPLVPKDTTIATILRYQIASNKLSIVWSYTGTPRAWKYFIPGKPSTLTTMVDGNAYWIYMRSADTLYVDGYVIAPTKTPPFYPLVTGWNLVGFKPQPTVTNETVDAYLSSTAGLYDVNSVWLYDNSNGTWIQATDSTMLHPGDAIWVRMLTAATLYPH